MKKPLLYLFVLCLTTSPLSGWADDFNLTAFYPTPSGNYKNIHLTPRPALASNNCHIGTIYANADDNSLPYYCGPSSTGLLSHFTPFPGPWILTGSQLYLTDISSPANKKVGIGTVAPIFKLTLNLDGGILADNISGSSSALPVSGAGTRMFWYPAKAAFRAGYATGAEWDDVNVGLYSMAMGYGNQALGQSITIWGGQNNSASGAVSPAACTIAGGKGNIIASTFGQILGGEGNTAGGVGARISGKNNASNGDYSVVGGGENNTAANVSAVVSGGLNNNSDGSYCTVSGGNLNKTPSIRSYITISGGGGAAYNANNYNDYSTIAGGIGHAVGGLYSAVGGGRDNQAAGNYSVIAGGQLNQALAPYSVIAGGFTNTANCAAGYCTVLGGSNNVASGNYATVLGGASNTASGNYAIIPGGSNNTAGGAYSLAAGKFMNVSGANTFVWGYSNAAIPAITTANAMIIYSGSMGIRDTNPAALLEINGNGSSDDYLNLSSTQAATGNILTVKNNGKLGVGISNPSQPLEFSNGAYVASNGTFMPASSRRYKDSISDLNFSIAHQAFAQLAPVRFRYNNEPEEEYLGFIAEDVPDLVIQKDRRGLAPMDIAAVLTKIIAQQHNVVTQQQHETEQLLNQINILKTRIRKKARQ